MLSSVAPSYAHFRAAQTVLANILQELRAGGAEVAYAIASPVEDGDAQSAGRLESYGVSALPGAAPKLTSADLPSNKVLKGARFVREAVDWRQASDRPSFEAPAREVQRILDWKPDAAILFWDSHYEHLLPWLTSSSVKVFGYIARPPFAAGATFAADRLTGVHRVIGRARMAGLERRHLTRMQGVKAARNICALDADWYDNHGVPCSYLPNTWPDAYGATWRDRRRTAEAARTGMHILGNIGGLNATGNRYGMRFLNDNVLPLLESRLKGQTWTVNICGRFELPDEFHSLKNHPHVAVRGFVPDIDDEVAGNSVFLLLNNAGPYTGGYTRVIYALSSGACLIAHRRLADSMPELVHDENCLLGSTAEEIADLIALAARDPHLRDRLGNNGRATYEAHYQPSQVARGLLQMVG
jgi:hypothetical protein